MKILHVGLTAIGEPYRGLSEALAKVSEYREVNNASNHKDDETVRVNREMKPDIIFFQLQQEGVISGWVLEQIKRDNPDAYVVNFTGDVRYPLPQWYTDFGKLISCTLFSNYTDVYTAREKGIKADYLQYAIDPKIFKPEGDKLNVPEIVFMANNYINQFPLSIRRSEMVLFLKRNYGHRFGVYGNNWEHNGNGQFNHSQLEEARAYRGAKIAINYSHFDYERYSSDRLFRILACGTMCISHRYSGIHKDFDLGNDLAVFDTFDHLKAQIDYYLDNDEERNRIAINGQQNCAKKFTFDAMVQNLLTLYKEWKANTSC